MIRLTSHISLDLATQAQDTQRPIKKKFTEFYASSNCKKTVSHINSQKVAFGR